jgi:hypothetical protein
MLSLKRSSRSVFVFLMAALTLGSLFGITGLAGAAPAQSPANVSMAGVHFYSGTTSMLDSTLPIGQRGWNVEYVSNVASCDGNPATDPEGVRAKAQRAKNDGLINIIRIDENNSIHLGVPRTADATWANNYINCTKELSDLSSVYIVGNEPNIENGGGAPYTPQEYATAFNYLYGRKGEMPAGTELLAVFNSPFTPPQWMHDMTVLLNGVDGFAIHTGGAHSPCSTDPRVACVFGGWSFDGGFRFYRNVIDSIDTRFWSKPVYITEFNTFNGDAGSEPANNYPTDWINNAFIDVRNYNAARGTKPPIKALIWFMDESRSPWGSWALTNPDPDTARARVDMGEEFKNPANHPGGAGPTPTPVTITPPPLSGRLDVFVRGTDNNIYRRWQQNGGGWSGWDPIGSPNGGANSDPSAVSWGSGRIDLFVRGMDNALWHRAFSGSWGNWESLGGVLTTGPDAASPGSGQVQVFLAGVNNQMWRCTYSNSTCAWDQVTGGLASFDQSGVSPSAGRTDVFARGITDGLLYHRFWNGGWSAWENLSGPITGGPDAASWGGGHMDVFARMSDNQIYHRWETTGSWAGWSVIGAPPGGATSDPSAVSPSPNRIDLFVRGGVNASCGNNALYHLAFANGAWGTSWECMGGTLTSAPDAASWSHP